MNQEKEYDKRIEELGICTRPQRDALALYQSPPATEP
jgi:hypothetical protein